MQMKALCGPDWMGSPACLGPVIFCGDLNASSQSKICKHLGLMLKNTHLDLKGHRSLKTLPSFYPVSLVDHIFVGAGFSTTKIEVPQTGLEKIASDHLPLLVDIQYTPDKKSSDSPDTGATNPAYNKRMHQLIEEKI